MPGVRMKWWKIVFIVGSIASCLPEDESGYGGVGVAVMALTDNCSGLPGNNPTTEISRLDVRVTGPDDKGRTVLKKVASFSIGGRQTDSVVVSEVPVALNNDITLLGYGEGSDQPLWFGRKRQVPVLADSENSISVVLARYSRFTCLSDPSNTFTHRAFASSVRLGDGMVLISGGFEHVSITGATTAVLDSPSDKAFIYNPENGTIEPTANTMTMGRAGHAMVFLPIGGGKVIVFGGTKKMTMRDDGSFPFSIDDGDSIREYEVFDVTTKTFTAAGNDAEGKPKQMLLKRAFLSAVRLFDDSSGSTILVTGGGSWPKDQNPDYQKAEIWASYVDGGKGGMQELAANRPVMYAQHNGAGVEKFEDTKEGLSRYLFVGGNDKKDVVEIYTQSSQQKEGVSGVFTEVSAPGLPPLYFPTVTRLEGKRFLVTGGVGISSGKLTKPSGKAYLLEPTGTNSFTVTPIESDCAMRFFHTATATYEGDKVTLLGGFTDFSGEARASTCIFDLKSKTFSTLAENQEAFLTRAGHIAEPLLDDTILVAGGFVTRNTLTETAPGFLELYVSPATRLELEPKPEAE